MTPVSSEVKRNRTAVIYLVVSVLGISLLPLAIVVVEAPDSPLLFGASLSAGTSVGALVFLAARYGSHLRDQRILALIRQNLVSWPMFFVLLGTFEFTFFAWGTKFVDATVATILWGSWPIIFVFLLSRIFSGRRERAARYRKITPSLVLMMVFSLIGLAFVVLAQASKQSGLDWTSDSSWIGFAFALLSGVLITFNIFAFSWAADLTRKAKDLSVFRESHSMELFFITVVVCISNAFTTPIKAVFSLAASEQIQMDVILMGLIFGATIRVGSSLLWRHANLITHALGINALGYAQPLFGVLWLALFWEVNISRLDYLIIGACAIISSNLLINSEVEIGPVVKSTILSLWGTGTVVYLRDLHPLWDSGRYFGILFLLSVLYILTLGLHVKSISFAITGRHTLLPLFPSKAAEWSAKVRSMMSRIQMGHVITLGVYGAAAMALAMFIRPVLEGWTGWLTEVLAVLLCTAIVSSALYALGLTPKSARKRPVVVVNENASESAPAGWEREDRRIAVWTSLLIAVGTCFSFLYLLWNKWLN